MNDKKRIILAMILPILFLLTMWLFYFSFLMLDVNMSVIGVKPRTFRGLVGVLLMVFAHGNIEHIVVNSVSFIVLSTALFYFYRTISYRVFFLTWFLSSFLLWLGGRYSTHIGASGLVYGLAFYLFFSGMFRKTKSLVALSLIVVLLYGGMIWGLMPIKAGVSWDGHLFGAITGILLAWVFRKTPLDPQPLSSKTNISSTLSNSVKIDYEYIEDV